MARAVASGSCYRHRFILIPSLSLRGLTPRPSLSLFLARGQLFRFGDLVGDRFKFVRSGRQKFQQLLPLLDGFLVIARLIVRAARKVERLLMLGVDLQRAIDRLGWFAGETLAVGQRESFCVVSPGVGVV